MLTVISPAKTLDFDSPLPTNTHTQPDFLSEAAELNAVLRGYTARRLGKLMSISDKLAEQNVQRVQNWQTPFNLDNARQAIYAFKGDVYRGLEAERLSTSDLHFAQKHLRILSGLYGLLRPLDLIQPYRLEMGSRLRNKKGASLYAFWGDKLVEAVNTELSRSKQRILVNLASQEYFSAIDRRSLDAELITPVFKDFKNGNYKVISFFAKKARGRMAAWIVRHRIDSAAALREFAEDGYCLDPVNSTRNELVFLRRSDS